ncbi:MAG: enolase C-terminal domain-like protein [Parachlamydiaceae bacterium]
MKIKTLSLEYYKNPLKTGIVRTGALLILTDDRELSSRGDIAPLPKWSRETLDEALRQLEERKQDVLSIEWTLDNCFENLALLNLLPSLSFALESALLALLSPIPAYTGPISALLMGTPSEIIEQAKVVEEEGFKSAKLKVSNLSFREAEELIHQLKGTFSLRVDVNRAWKTEESLRFFSQFAVDDFDYVEEPFYNPHDLHLFTHPFAVDESFPHDLSLEQLDQLSGLKALVYKPTIQGGMLRSLPLYEWTKKRGIQLVLSCSFESDVGLSCVASIASRLGLNVPVGLGGDFRRYFHSNKKSVNSAKGT